MRSFYGIFKTIQMQENHIGYIETTIEISGEMGQTKCSGNVTKMEVILRILQSVVDKPLLIYPDGT